MTKRTVELNLWGEPFEEKPRADALVLQLDEWSDRTFRRLMARGEPWWVAADLCRMLDLAAGARHIREHLDDDECSTVAEVCGTADVVNGLRYDALLVNEPGLYRLIFESRKPEARAFKRWIAHEVLPSIRKTGGYSNKSRRIDRMVKRLGTDDAATLVERFEDLDQNRFINRYLADNGAKPIDFARFYNAIYRALTGKMAAELRRELGQKYYQTPLDRMSDEVLGLQKMVKRMAMRFIRERSEVLGRPLVADEWGAIVEETAAVVVDSFVSRLGFQYGFGIADDPGRGPILDLIRRQIEASN